MLELIKSLGFALMMVPVVMFLIMGLIYGLGAFFNLLSKAHVPHHHNSENK
ncbi:MULTISPECIES: AcrZ family multidrug efflux pump-associated protein [unclassified Providencia]|uniref:AcrZ family multidrug efflux pump-associated protein n=1 Tax=unclassified Providencia TaxID=2633465 RepID=UPI000E8A4618|nr:AcrZ family multidrug efflux pump-associated protein [Providencia sp.]MBP6082668.1 AcrZ family multidrug efflux pump-associated protein [Providencia sp.]HBO21771.1 multidrug efflux pump-associated protein, AcrZ family [Providencia sp.]